MPESLCHWITLSQTPGLSYSSIKALCQHFNGIQNLMIAKKQELRAIHLSPQQIQAILSPNQQYIDEALEWNNKNNHHMMTIESHNYPRLLKEIASPPLILYIKGQIQSLKTPCIAMVGSRNPSYYGKETAREIGYHLAQSGLAIVSGLARGIDAECHRIALRTHQPTLAILGCGLYSMYPKQHLHLSEEIIECGALLSEFPLHSPPKRHHFPQRNRIISGLSLGVVVVEAAMKSGSLITARCAVEQNREVFAVPGPISSGLSKGCHALIQQGAKLIENQNDILIELSNFSTPSPSAQPASQKNKTQALDASHKKLLECIGFDVTHPETIIDRSRLCVQEATCMLLNLEFLGYISSTPGGYQREKK